MSGWSGREADKLVRLNFYPQDYLSDPKTAQLTWEEHGVYMLLLWYEWGGGPLPSDPARLARILKATPEDFGRVWPAVSEFFEIDPESGGLVNPRIERERAKALTMIATKRDAGLASAKRRKHLMPNKAQSVNPTATQTSNTCSTDLQQKDVFCSNQQQQQQQQQQYENPPPPSGSGPSVSDLVAAWSGECPHLPQPPAKLSASLRKTITAALKREKGRDWPATFERVARSDFLSGRTKEWSATLEWICGPKNLAKLDAGNYDNRGSVHSESRTERLARESTDLFERSQLGHPSSDGFAAIEA